MTKEEIKKKIELLGFTIREYTYDDVDYIEIKSAGVEELFSIIVEEKIILLDSARDFFLEMLEENNELKQKVHSLLKELDKSGWILEDAGDLTIDFWIDLEDRL